VIDKTISYQSIGDVCFQSSKRARRINIRVNSSHSIRVAIPPGINLAVAQRFFEEHSAWVKRALVRVHRSENEHFCTDGDWLDIRDQRYLIKIKPAKKFGFAQMAEGIEIGYPQKYAIADPVVQNYVKQVIIEILRKEAKRYLPGRVVQLAQRSGFDYRQVFIKNQKSRWGSCSSKNNLNLNLQLMRLNNSTIDYIILHELVHTRIKNHSPKFWNTLRRLHPDIDRAKRQLKAIKLIRI
jgi:predicted metal-dependent hydrolase